MRWVAQARWLIATLWVGSIWTVGYLVAPTLFATLHDRALAGTVAGSLFRVEAWVSVVCAGLLLLLMMLSVDASQTMRQRRSLFLLIAGMLACTVVSHFGLQPLMADLRATSQGIMNDAVKAQFGMLHGISSGIYLVQSLLGIALILKIR